METTMNGRRRPRCTMLPQLLAVSALLTVCRVAEGLNLAPFFTADMNQHTLKENTPLGSVVYTLQGQDPEGSRVRFGILGTDKLVVDPATGQVSVAKEIDREARGDRFGDSSQMRLTVTIEDEVGEGEGMANLVQVPVSVIILDENDNEPVFQGAPYKVSINEDTPVGTTVFQALEVTDVDLIGEVLDVACDNDSKDDEGQDDVCDFFDIVPRRQETDHDMYRGSVVLKKPLDYRVRRAFRVPLTVFDGNFTVRETLTFNVMDVQNRPPIFAAAGGGSGGSLTGIVSEDAEVGSRVLVVKAKDGDTGDPRRVVYSLLDDNDGGLNTGNSQYFAIDPNTGEVRVDKSLDREALAATSGVITLKVRASEVANSGLPGAQDGVDSTVTDVTITVRDVNDEPPAFNQREYSVAIPENVPFGTPLANLNMEVADPDTGPNAAFKLDLIDSTGKFAVEPQMGRGRTAVTIKVNSRNLDYENPSERQFLLRVLASETTDSGVAGSGGNPSRRSSTATITVEVLDLNDNSPVFDKDSYTAIVTETAAAGTEVAVIAAKDPDGGDFGTQGIRYSLSGTGSELFDVDPASGRITVASCPAAAESSCLDYEVTKAYFLSYSASDNLGQGRRSVVNLRISVADANDNPPAFALKEFRAQIDEGQSRFQPRLFLKAVDPDESSTLKFAIVGGNENNLFAVDRFSGEVTVAARSRRRGGGTAQQQRQQQGLNLDNVRTDTVQLQVEVSDGASAPDRTVVTIGVRDINDRAPIFEQDLYQASVAETAGLGTAVEVVRATDADYGINAEVSYLIQRGAFDDFAVDPDSGAVTLSGTLDYDRKDSYTMELVGVDKGTPALTGTATLVVTVLNKNNKMPHFLPATQRAHVTEDAAVGTEVLTLNATDLDAEPGQLAFSIVEPITAVGRDGGPVAAEGQGSSGDPVVQAAFKSFFAVDNATGTVTVANRLDRNAASSVTLRIRVTDQSANPPQDGYGTLVVTIVDVNDFAPEFQLPWTADNPFLAISVQEELPVGTVVHKFVATDQDSNISKFRVVSTSGGGPSGGGGGGKTPPYFGIDPDTGDLHVRRRIDFENQEELGPDRDRLTFNVTVSDTGVPTKTATAVVRVKVVNVNDEAPGFPEHPNGYHVSVPENSASGTEVAVVEARDMDDGEFGQVRYSLAGYYKDYFAIDPVQGRITVADPAILDREALSDVYLMAVATDLAPPGSRKSASVPVNVTILDVNDNKPSFLQLEYQATIVDNIPFEPPEPSPIVQVSAFDPDEGENGKVVFTVTSGNEGGYFRMDPSTGILYPNASFRGQQGRTFEVVVQVEDGTGAQPADVPFPDDISETGGGWRNPDRATIRVTVENVNSHKPLWLPGPPPNESIEILEEQEPSEAVVMKVAARDDDEGEDNGRVSYFFKVNSSDNVLETDEFSIDEATGEVRAKVTFDRETASKYELVIVARDHGTPVAFETLRFVTVNILDINDNSPAFGGEAMATAAGGADPAPVIRITVPEEEEPGYFLGKVEAKDPDAGKNGRVYYYIVSGNEGAWFSVDKTYGNLYTKKRLDREERDRYVLVIKASNDPDHVCEATVCDIDLPSSSSSGMADGAVSDPSLVTVQIFVSDKDDNLPVFESTEYFVGIPYDAKVGDLVLQSSICDPDLVSGNSDHKADLSYAIRNSNLYRAGSSFSAGSLVPSPFQMEASGRLVLASLMAEFNQDRFRLEIEAKEVAGVSSSSLSSSPGGYRAKATVNVWIYEPHQLVKVVIRKSPEEANRVKSEVVARLSNATQGHIVVIDYLKYHIDHDGHVDEVRDRHRQVGGQRGGISEEETVARRAPRGAAALLLSRDMTDMYVHLVDKDSNTIMDPDEVLQLIDASYDRLAAEYQQLGVEEIVAAAATAAAEGSGRPLQGAGGATRTTTGAVLDKNLAALIALLLVLFVGIVMFSILCCCVKSFVFFKAASKGGQQGAGEPNRKGANGGKMQLLTRDSSASPHPDYILGGDNIYNTPGSLADHLHHRHPLGGDVAAGTGLGAAGTTDNPLWMDQKYQAYEEQELTMTVFSDQDNSVTSGTNGNGGSTASPGDGNGGGGGGGGGSASRASNLHLLLLASPPPVPAANGETQSNAYATISKLPNLGGHHLFHHRTGGNHHRAEPPGVPDRDYATLEKSYRSPPGPVVPGIHSTPVFASSGAALSRRFSNGSQQDFAGIRRPSPPGGGGHAARHLTINRNGEPELVADLI